MEVQEWTQGTLHCLIKLGVPLAVNVNVCHTTSAKLPNRRSAVISTEVSCQNGMMSVTDRSPDFLITQLVHTVPCRPAAWCMATAALT